MLSLFLYIYLNFSLYFTLAPIHSLSSTTNQTHEHPECKQIVRVQTHSEWRERWYSRKKKWKKEKNMQSVNIRLNLKQTRLIVSFKTRNKINEQEQTTTKNTYYFYSFLSLSLSISFSKNCVKVFYNNNISNTRYITVTHNTHTHSSGNKSIFGFLLLSLCS